MVDNEIAHITKQSELEREIKLLDQKRVESKSPEQSSVEQSQQPRSNRTARKRPETAINR
jgi:hypothetical protein